tara:strand:+ start:1369 stop:2742 length:1374 start_codon:yes stop_codon:yes gene_type:complete
MLNNIINIYFLGIGGIGMSGLAQWAKLKGFNIKGWDDAKNTQTIEMLREKGIVVHDLSTKSQFLSFFNSLNKRNTILVYTSAVSDNHAIFKLFKNKGFNLYKRADLLQFISKEYSVIAIAGTHGKTTISIMLAHILKYSGINCNAFFGGISKNYQANFMIGDSNIMVIEADEYDKSFLKLNPHISLVSSLDKDHGDIYKNNEEMLYAYEQFMLSTKKCVIGNNKLTPLFDFTYDIESNADFYAHSICSKKDMLYFYINFPNNIRVKTSLLLGSYYNVKNAVAAAALAFSIGLNPTDISKGLRSFKGVSRRLDYHSENNSNFVLIDDYAHHPEELRALIHSVKLLYKNKKIFLIFQPHLFSRTQEFENQFAQVLSSVDQLILLDIYPAREKPVPGISAKNLIKKINLKSSWHLSGDMQDHMLHNAVKDLLSQYAPDIIITAGAGDVYQLIPTIKTIFS